MNNLRDEITVIVQAIAEGDDDYWNGNGYFGVLDQQAVVADIMAAVVKHDGEEMLEAFGAA